jgi:signal transduction histidine kinase
VSNASHELRTPLSTITAQLEVTLLNRRSVEEYQLVLNSVLEDIKDLNRLSEALLDLTLASRDKSLMKFTDVRVDELLFQSREDLLKRKQDYHINIRFSEFPEDEKKLSVYGKEYLLKSAFMNLMDNACKFSSDKTVEVSCEVGVRTIQIHFSDRGIGMPASYIGKIYTPLVRGDNARRYPGHGLGLALCSKIVELHHGSISFISKEGEGTTITITLSTR